MRRVLRNRPRAEAAYRLFFDGTAENFGDLMNIDVDAVPEFDFPIAGCAVDVVVTGSARRSIEKVPSPGRGAADLSRGESWKKRSAVRRG